MKNLHLSLILLGLILTSSASYKRPLYQVLTSHPHEVKEFSPYIRTVRQEGRLWLVELDERLPVKLQRFFRRTDGQDVRHYLVPKFKAVRAALPLIEEFIARLDTDALKTDVLQLTQFKTRAAGTEDNRKAIAQVKEMLQSLGYTTQLSCYRAETCSVIAEKLGETKKVIMLMAHVDSVGKSFAGADDNASGTAVLMEVARVLKDYGNKHGLRFFITNGEESGLLGAKYYADSLKRSGDIKNLILAINMDMVGYNANGVVELETDSQYEGLANWFAQLATTYTKLRSKITIGAWGSDHVPFIQGGVPTLLTIEDWSTKTPCYHAECDRPETLNYNYMTEIAKLNLAAIMTKDLE